MDFSLETAQSYFSSFYQGLRHWQFGNKKQLAFLEDLFVLINDGVPPNRAIDMMANVATGLNKEVAMSLSENIARGQPLADGMSEWFSPNVVEIIRVGEAGGALAQTIKSSINMLSQRGVAIGSFIGALAYPLFVLVIGCVVMVYLNTSVLDQFKAIKPLDQWPTSGQNLVYFANLIQSWWWAVVVAVIAIILFFRYAMRNYTGQYRVMLDKIPPFSFYRRLAAARMLETLGLLVANGVVFKSAIRVMQHQANPYLGTHLMTIERLLAMGRGNIAEVLDTGLIDEKDLMRLRVMAEVKGFEHGLVRMGVRGTEESIKTLKFIARVFGGIMLAAGGLLIILIVQGIYMTGMSMGG